ncbi:MAG TPA: FAD-dependent oxidoreductase [Gaiellaceae bacterium]|nr:FAD-dependent oxidoreductase [Gaiellaceae bacterium]
MTRTSAPPRRETHVLVAGGGVAALETALALRHLAAELVDVELVAPELHFFYRPLAVAEAFGVGRTLRWELADLARAAGVDFTPGEVVGVEPDERVVRLRTGPALPYDVLVLACGARLHVAVPGALTFRGPADVDGLRRLLGEIVRGEVERLVFAVPSGIVWPLPLYELALLAAAELAEKGAAPELTLVTAEPAPLAIFGEPASEAVAAHLAERGIEILPMTYPVELTGQGLVTGRGSVVPADRAVAAPRLSGPDIAGVPRDRNGFVRTDPHGRVTGLESVYAVGDMTAFPVKQGGLAAQQADAAAEAIAARAGVALDPQPFRPVLRALLLGGGTPTYLRVELGGRGESSTASDEPLWWPAGKIAGRHLGPFLAGLGAPDPPADTGDDVLRVEIESARAHMLGWPR